MIRTAWKQNGTIRVDAFTLRRITPSEIRIKVTACGICGTDLHVTPGGDPKPVQFGHEIAGTILELGSAVMGLTVGQSVALDSSTPCGRCANCRNMQQELCSDIQSFFCINSFGMADEMITPAINAVPAPDMDPAVACLSEPLGVAIDMVRLAEITPASNVLVIGAGAIGLMAIALARRAGARRIYCSQSARRPARCALAAQFGATIIDSRRTPLKNYAFDGPINRIMVTAPPAALAEAFSVASKGAIISFIGIEYGAGAECRFDANEFHFKKLQLRASFASPAIFTPQALTFLREGVVDGPALISHRFKLDDVAEAMSVARDAPDALKVIVTP